MSSFNKIDNLDSCNQQNKLWNIEGSAIRLSGRLEIEDSILRFRYKIPKRVIPEHLKSGVVHVTARSDNKSRAMLVFDLPKNGLIHLRDGTEKFYKNDNIIATLMLIVRLSVMSQELGYKSRH